MRTKEDDRLRKRALYASNPEYREKHKEKMRLKYHLNKAKALAERVFPDTPDSVTDMSE